MTGPASDTLSHPAASDGTAASLRDAKVRAARALLDAVTEAGLVVVGPVVFHEWTGPDVARALAHLGQQDYRVLQYVPWFTEHPTGTFVLATVVTGPAP